MGISVNVDISNHFKVGHNWGALLGSSLVKDRPDWFSRLVILNTNNLPDGEVNPDRFHRKSDFSKFLIFDAAFLVRHNFNIEHISFIGWG